MSLHITTIIIIIIYCKFNLDAVCGVIQLKLEAFNYYIEPLRLSIFRACLFSLKNTSYLYYHAGMCACKMHFFTESG